MPSHSVHSTVGTADVLGVVVGVVVVIVVVVVVEADDVGCGLCFVVLLAVVGVVV